MEIFIHGSLHKRNFRLDTGECANDGDFSILTFKVKADSEGNLLVKLPPEDELDALIGSSRCKSVAFCVLTDHVGMVRKSTAEALGRNPATAISIVAPEGGLPKGNREMSGDCGSENTVCGSSQLEW